MSKVNNESRKEKMLRLIDFYNRKLIGEDNLEIGLEQLFKKKHA